MVVWMQNGDKYVLFILVIVWLVEGCGLLHCPESQESNVCLQCGRPGFDPWVWKIHQRRKWQPTPVFLPGESHGRRRLVAYSPRGRKESDTTERLN